MTTSPETGPTGEISLDDIDSLIAADDPSFVSGLNEIKDVAAEEPVDIESSVPDEDGSMSPEDALAGSSLWSRIPILKQVLGWIQKRVGGRLQKIRSRVFASWLKLRARLVALFYTVFNAIRTLPGGLKALSQNVFVVVSTRLGKMRSWFKGLSRFRQAMALIFFTGIVVFGGLLFLNLRGFWIPLGGNEILYALADKSTRTWEYNKDEQMVPFLQAFPQAEHGFEFSKMVVNLKRSGRHSNPMGLFEVYVTFDGKDAAVEAQAREKELSDLLQRKLEEMPYEEIQGPLGRKRLKDLLRQELNSVLNHGWAHDIYIKNMVLKP